MSDAVLTFGLIGAFAALVTAHVATIFGLARAQHRAQAYGALFLPPLAPYWAFTRGMRVRAIIWVACAVLYVTAFLLAR